MDEEIEQNFMSPIKVKSAVQIVVDRLTQAIISGQLKAGDRVPTEPELSESFGVGRNTVREAVRILIAYGILEIRRPDGTFVCDTFNPQGINPMIYGLILTKDDAYDELIDLRKMFEFGMMFLLGEKGLSPQQHANLLKFAQAIEKAVNTTPVSIDLICKADVEFHDALVKATNNQLLISIHDMLIKLTIASRNKTIEKVMSNNQGQYLVDTHFDLLDKLKDTDTTKLYQSIQNSYFYWKDIYK